mmetsp:Transcript_103888/g.300477  ORF Transcript_103888/g.300477 Transcript_103888/m.300477 type:complete len:229 (+) Transcript_103888:1327-2013(+)
MPANMSALATRFAGNLAFSGTMREASTHGMALLFAGRVKPVWGSGFSPPTAELRARSAVVDGATQKVANAVLTSRCKVVGIGGRSVSSALLEMSYILKAPSARDTRMARILLCITSGRKSSFFDLLACSASAACCFITARAIVEAMRGVSRSMSRHWWRLHVTNSPSSNATAKCFVGWKSKLSRFKNQPWVYTAMGLGHVFCTSGSKSGNSRNKATDPVCTKKRPTSI